MLFNLTYGIAVKPTYEKSSRRLDILRSFGKKVITIKLYLTENAIGISYLLSICISDAKWNDISAIIVCYSDHITVTKESIEAIHFILFNGVPWRNLPESYGAWKTIYNKYNELNKCGLWTQINEYLQNSIKAENINNLTIQAENIAGTISANNLPKASQNGFGTVKMYVDGTTLYINNN